MNLNDRFERDDRAVSPVIGVILMVAITVILAAVIGAFVIGIGGNQNNAPSANIAYDQQFRNYSMDTSHTDLVTVRTKGNHDMFGETAAELRTITATHDGGDALKRQTIRVEVSADREDEAAGLLRGEAIGANATTAGWVNHGWNYETTSEITAQDSAAYNAFLVPSNLNDTQQGALDNSREETTLGLGTSNHPKKLQWYTFNVSWTDRGDYFIAAETGSDGDEILFGDADNVQSVQRGDEFQPNDELIVIWSPQGSDQTSELSTYEVS